MCRMNIQHNLTTSSYAAFFKLKSDHLFRCGTGGELLSPIAALFKASTIIRKKDLCVGTIFLGAHARDVGKDSLESFLQWFSPWRPSMKAGTMEFSITRRILLQRIDLLLFACPHFGGVSFPLLVALA
jgi:hypothetical protein